MADRRVTATGKGDGGNITKLGYPGQAWSPRTKADAIRDIEAKTDTYYVVWPPGYQRTEVRSDSLARFPSMLPGKPCVSAGDIHNNRNQPNDTAMLAVLLK